MCCKRFKHMLHVQRQLCNKANKHWNSNRTRYRCYMPVLNSAIFMENRKVSTYYDRLQIPHVIFKSGIIPFSLFKSNHVHVFPTVVCPGGGGGEHICVYIYIHTCIHVTCNHRQIYIYVYVCTHALSACVYMHAYSTQAYALHVRL